MQSLFDNTPVKAHFQVPEFAFPSQARVVIVGGGVAGTSLAYHFARAGWNDVVLLEQNQISSGTTWHAAGMVGQLRTSSAQTKVNKASTELYARLMSETGHDPGWLQCGGLQIASCQERLFQLQRSVAMAHVNGVAAEMLSASECADFWPIMRTDDLVGGVHLPGDGRVLPGESAKALAMGAMQGGVRVFEHVAVEQLLYRESASRMKGFSGVRTDCGEIRCEWIVVAGNMWMRQIGLSVGVDIPVYPCEHHYVITRPIDGLTRDCPCGRDPDVGNYFRTLDDGSVKLGTFKKRSKPWQIGDTVPNDIAFRLLEPDWEDFEQPLRDHLHRFPAIRREDILKFVNGPEAFTPDNNFIMGQPFCTDGLFVMGGWNSAGIACAGGAGKFAVEWIENGGMTLDLGSVDIRRFMPFQNGRQYLQERVSEVLGLHYQMSWPGRQMETARNVRASELLEFHQQHNACFGETAGWERPLFYAATGTEPKIAYSFLKQNWHEIVVEEVKACRESVALLDQSTFAKFELTGPDALNLLQHMCGANMDREIGRAVYTGMFNSNGTFESDLTVVRTGVDSFYIVTATGQQQRDHDWIARHIGNNQVELADVTTDWAVVSVMGPQSPMVLNRLDSTAFPMEEVRYGTVRNLSIDSISIRALRISYVGEQGWELHVPVDSVRRLANTIMEVGAELGIRPIGSYAISAMRIEKGFRAIGHDLSSAETPLEAGLAWAIDWDKQFLGKTALLKKRQQPLAQRLVCFALDDPEITLWGTEPILMGGELVGYTTSACFGPTIGASVAMGYVKHPTGASLKASDLLSNSFEIVQLAQRYRARASLKPWV